MKLWGKMKMTNTVIVNVQVKGLNFIFTIVYHWFSSICNLSYFIIY